MTDLNTRKVRGAADPVSLLVLALAAVLLVKAPTGAPGKDHWWQFWRKNPIEQAAKAGAELDAARSAEAATAAAEQAKIDAEKAKQLRLAQEAALATSSAITAAQTTTAAGKLPVRELETAVAVSRANTQAMDQALGPASPERVRELEAMVANLNAGVAAGTKALELMQTALDRTVADKAAAAAELARVQAAGAAAIAAAEAKLAEKDQALQTFAGERDALARRYEQLMFAGKLGVVLFAAVLVYALFLLIRTRTLGAFSTDMVGLAETLKNKLKAEYADQTKYAALKEEIARDWSTAADGTATLVAKAKAALRL